jgi:hypothetical protein
MRTGQELVWLLFAADVLQVLLPFRSRWFLPRMATVYASEAATMRVLQPATYRVLDAAERSLPLLFPTAASRIDTRLIVSGGRLQAGIWKPNFDGFPSSCFISSCPQSPTSSRHHSEYSYKTPYLNFGQAPQLLSEPRLALLSLRHPRRTLADHASATLIQASRRWSLPCGLCCS